MRPRGKQAHQQLSAPLFKALYAWLQVRRRQVPDGGAIAGAIANSLNHWTALTADLGRWASRPMRPTVMTACTG